MSIRAIQPTESLDSVWEELVYTEARLIKEPLAAAFAPSISALIERTETAWRGQRLMWRMEIVAQAGVDAGDDDLDELVNEVDTELRYAERGERSSARRRRYFPQAPSLIIRLGLESELEKVNTWPASLAGEPEPALQQLGTRLAATIAAGDEALAERRKAAGQRADHRVREILRLVDDANATRLSIYGELVKIGTANRKPKDWPHRFFRRAQRPAPTTSGET